MLTPIADFYFATSYNVAAITTVSASTFVAVTTEPALYQFTYQGNQVNKLALPFTPSGVAIYSGASAIVSYGTTAQFDFVDLGTLYRASATTNATSTQTGVNAYQLVANSSTGYAAATSSTAGKVSIINCLTRSVSAYTPGLLSGQAINCVASRDNGNFILGTNNGNIYEITVAGNIVSGYSLPSIPNNNVSPFNYPIVALSYGSSAVIAVGGRGEGYSINLGASSVVGTFICSEGVFGSSTTVTLSNVSSGVFLAISNSPGVATQGVQEYFTNTLSLRSIDSTFMEPNIAFRDAKIDSTGKYAVIATQDTNNIAFRARSFYITPTWQTTVSTRAQYPVGVDIPGNIIRIRNRGVGYSCIDVDQAITAGANNILAAENNQYIEVLLNGASGVSEMWDIREFVS